MYFYFYQVIMIVSLVLSLFVIGMLWRRRHYPAAAAMTALVISIFVWTLGYFLESHSSTLERQLLFNNIGYLGSMSVPVAWFVFALNYSSAGRLLRGRKIIFFCILPFIFTVFIWTNNFHHLMWSNEHLGTSGAFTITIKTYGPVFWAALVHNYLLVLAGGIVLLRRLFVGPHLYAGQAVSLIVAVCLPWVWNMLYVFDMASLPRKDLTPAMFAVSGIALTLGLMRFHLFKAVPFARELIIQQLKEGVLVFDRHNTLLEANSAALKILGVDKSVIGKLFEGLVDASRVFERLQSTGFTREELTLAVSGEKRIYELEKMPVLNRQEQQAGWLAIFYDITERKKAEEKYRLLAEYSADVIYKYSIKDGKFTYVTPSAEKLVGYTESEALNVDISRFLTPESSDKQAGQLKKDLQNGISRRIIQLEAVHKDGHIIPVEVHCSFIIDDEGQPVEVIGVVRDITERKKMEEQLIMQDRLASIGQLAAGLAHELSNPLTGIINYSSLLLDRDLPEDMKQDVYSIRDEARRTADIVKNLLAFTRKQPLEKKSVNLNDSVKKVADLRAYEQKVNNIEVNFNLDPSLPLVYGNDSQLQQVFFNIIVNAEFFMLQAHKRGTLNIVTEKAGDYVRVSFTDDGPGIPAEDIKNLFTPFFTTKGADKGTGLSLSICLGIVSEHGGKIWAESQPGKGSTFIIEFPVYCEDSV